MASAKSTYGVVVVGVGRAGKVRIRDILQLKQNDYDMKVLKSLNLFGYVSRWSFLKMLLITVNLCKRTTDCYLHNWSLWTGGPLHMICGVSNNWKSVTLLLINTSSQWYLYLFLAIIDQNNHIYCCIRNQKIVLSFPSNIILTFQTRIRHRWLCSS